MIAGAVIEAAVASGTAKPPRADLNSSVHQPDEAVIVYAYPKCKNIVVDDASPPYRDEVARYLDLIATTDVGRTLYAFIGKTTKTVRITWTLGQSWLLTGASPMSRSDIDRIARAAERISRLRRMDMEDAVETAVREDAALQSKVKAQYFKDHPVMREIPIAVLDTLGLHSTFTFPTTAKGAGEGADIELDYHPAAYEQIMKNAGRVPIGMGPGESLDMNGFMRCARWRAWRWTRMRRNS